MEKKIFHSYSAGSGLRGVCSPNFGIPQFGLTFQINKLYRHFIRTVKRIRRRVSGLFGEMEAETTDTNPLRCIVVHMVFRNN